MDQIQERELLSGGACYLHDHPEDRAPTHDTLSRLESLAKIVTKSANYTASLDDDWILVSATCTITLPPPKANKLWNIVCMTGTTTVTVAAPTGFTINGGSSITIASQWLGKRIKQISSTSLIAI